MLDDGKWLGILDTKLLGLILELGTLDPMLFVIIIGNSEGITVSREEEPWLVKMEVPSLGFVLTGISLATVDGPLLCIEIGDVLDNIASEGAFEGISEGDTEPLPPN